MSHDVLELFDLSPVAEAEVDKIISNFRDKFQAGMSSSLLLFRLSKTALKFP